MASVRQNGRKPKKKISRDVFFYGIIAFVAFFICLEIALYNYVDLGSNENVTPHEKVRVRQDILKPYVVQQRPKRVPKKITLPDHLLPKIPIFPLFDSIENGEEHISNLLKGKPTMAGAVALMQRFISDLHDHNMEVKKAKPSEQKGAQMVLDSFYKLAEKHLKPFDEAYMGKHIFPIREDDSIFISLAAFREWYLTETLESAFKNAKNPEKIFVGAIVQNCFGKFNPDGSFDSSGTPCHGGTLKTGVDGKGKPLPNGPDLPPDKNGVEVFCANPDYEQFCKNGQIRVLYMHHTDGQGPSMARYLASKLWGGEHYFMQIDSHLRFAYDWDAKFIAELKLTSNYPKSVFSSYPPGFDQVRFIPRNMGIDLSTVNNETVIESPGCRLCHCSTPSGNNPMVHIKQSRSYHGNEIRPAQQPFLGAGLIFSHANLLKEVPYDPYLPWTFMGEEIVLSMRAWTNGWNMYAPRKNWIIHQYRPAKLGLPKFYASIKEQFNFGMTKMQRKVTRRMKYLMGYPYHTKKLIKNDHLEYVLAEVDNYGMGTVRTLEDFMNFSEMTINPANGDIQCPERLGWCFNQTYV